MGSLKVIIFQYARDIWRRRWYAVGVAWAICLVGWVIVSRMPDIYDSNARVYMNSDEALTPLLRGIAVGSSGDEKFWRFYFCGVGDRAQRLRPESQARLQLPDQQRRA